jgi:hypothetical protein
MITVKIHPVSSLELWAYDTPSLQGDPDEQPAQELQLVDDLGAAFLVARAMLTVIDRLIAAPPVHEIEQHLAASRAETR